jgi:hypothetical protein
LKILPKNGFPPTSKDYSHRNTAFPSKLTQEARMIKSKGLGLAAALTLLWTAVAFAAWICPY